LQEQTGKKYQQAYRSNHKKLKLDLMEMHSIQP
jgi:hypothetical protein